MLGTIKDQTWYQYGYFIPQGPLPNVIATGWRIREIGAKVLAHLEQDPWDIKQQARIIQDINSGRKVQEPGESIIGIFSRKLNRLILNEEELAKGLEAEFGLRVVFLRMEEMSLNTITKYMRRTAIAIGMHGSLLAMGIFLPPGAILIEGYPYGVPANNYTPYKTMCNLPGMKLVYRAWSCGDPNDAIGYPDKPADKGGIKHLPEAEQRAILESTTIEPHLCCTNPYWLYRIYQDTRINLSQVIAHIRSAVAESYQGLPENLKMQINL
jgi:protein O-mannose beta-1,4-N-acetylglucosaminyltransferase